MTRKLKRSNFFIHIGLGRTGTDYLQRKIFPKLQGIKYIDRYNSKRFNKYRINLFYNSEFRFEKKNMFSIKKKTLISTENFFNPENYLEDIIRKINYFYPKPQIILFLREPFQHLVSSYRYSVDKGMLWRRLDEYFEFEDMRKARNMTPNKIFFKNSYRYDEIIKILKKHFIVHIFKYERVFKSFESMNKFITVLNKITKSSFKGKFTKKEFKRINVGLRDNELKKKRIINFKKDHIFPLKKISINSDYFTDFHTQNFKTKFYKNIKKNYKI
tara:strand:+ start:3232 stop:4047 length:816 start_codon:yes stop_codon:yes gene_type:complete